jgi:hypothetical protein
MSNKRFGLLHMSFVMVDAKLNASPSLNRTILEIEMGTFTFFRLTSLASKRISSISFWLATKFTMSDPLIRCLSCKGLYPLGDLNLRLIFLAFPNFHALPG